jgi:hypothetical protein
VARVLLPTPVPPGGEVTIDLEFHAKVPKVFARAGYKGDFLAVTQWFPKLGVYEPAGMRGREKSGWNCHQYHANTEYYADYGRFKVEITVPQRFVVGATGPETARRENPTAPSPTCTSRPTCTTSPGLPTRAFSRYRERFSADKDVTPAEYAATAKLLDRSGGRSEAPRRRDPAPPAAGPRAADRPATSSVGEARPQVVRPLVRHLSLPDADPGRSRRPARAAPTASSTRRSSSAAPATSFNFWPGKGFREAEIVTVHEFGHQFWYGLVGSNEFEEAWLDEGFTTYSTAKVMELGYGRDASFVDFLGLEVGAVEADRRRTASSAATTRSPPSPGSSRATSTASTPMPARR